MVVVHRKQQSDTTGNEEMPLKTEAGYLNGMQSILRLPSVYLERFSNLKLRHKLSISE